MSATKSNDIDTIRQWGIKAISSRVIDEITQEIAELAAAGQKLTAGQMIEKLWAHYRSGGVLQAEVTQVTQVNPLDELVRLVAAGGPWGEHNPLPGDVRKLMNSHARAVHGVGTSPALPPPSPTAAKPKVPRDKWAHLKHLQPPPGKTGLEDLAQIDALDED